MFDSKMVFSHCSFKSFFEISWCAFWNLLVFDTFLKIFIKCFGFLGLDIALDIFFLCFSIPYQSVFALLIAVYTQ